MKKINSLLILIIFTFSFSSNALARNNLSAEVLFSMGETYAKNKDYTRAKTELRKCLLLNPEHKEAKKLLGRLEEKIIPISPNKPLLIATKQEEIIKTSEQPSLPAEKINYTPSIQKGAWTLKKNQLYTEIYTKYYWHNQEFTNKGRTRRWANNGEYCEIKTEYKIEFGLTDRYTLLLYIPFVKTQWKDNLQKKSDSGFVYFWPGIKYLLFEDPFICSLQWRMKFPFNFNENTTAALGKHQIDAEFKLLTGQVWPDLPGYAKGEIGLRFRNEEPANEIPYYFELGYNLTPDLILKAALDGQKGLPQTGGISEDWTKATFGPMLKIKDILNLEFGYGNTLIGKNSSVAEEIFFTVASQW